MPTFNLSDESNHILSTFASQPVHSPYHYVPTHRIAILFVTLYGISTLFHTSQTVFYRMWFLFPTACLAGLIEILGWSGRLWSSVEPGNFQAFEMQIVGTILAPTPLVAANFIILGRIIQRLGVQYSRLSPRWYTAIFCTCDAISLIVQAVGGGMASTAVGNHRNPTTGGNVMLGGIVFQMVTITVYVFCAAEFFFRYFADAPVHIVSQGGGRGVLSRRVGLMISALAFNTICLFIRAVYRTIELSDGWAGRIISTQIYFNVLDGGMVTLAIYTLNIAHPGWLLAQPTGEAPGSPASEGSVNGLENEKAEMT